MIAGTMQLLAEAITLGEANGLDRADLLEVVAGSAIASPVVGYKTKALVERDYTATFSTALLKKDLDLAVAAADGLGELDFLALLAHLQHLAGRATDVPVAARS
jgi:3-hydroxyisobutyrate dehydrogenase-like beta-hydroxyacid dehydrogenase